MSWSELAVLVLVVAGVVGWLVWVAASRLDRLHRKVTALRAVLDTQLVRRASAATELAASGLLDPVSSVLVGEAAWVVLAAGGLDGSEIARLTSDVGGPVRVHPVAATQDPLRGGPMEPVVDRGLAESELSSTLRAALDDPGEVEAMRAEPGGNELLDTLAAAWYRVQLTRRFHNEAVAQSQRMRRTFFARRLPLAGHAPVPRTVELDDGWPDALGRPGAGAHASIQTSRTDVGPSV